MGKAVETKKKQTGSYFQRSKIWVSLVTTTLGVVASLLSSVIATADLLNVSKEWMFALAAGVATVVISVGLTSILSRRERGSSRIAKIKDDLAYAYLDALENSILNPLHRGQQ